jgi:membrane peptidoglycan carboxypeptidase
VAAVGSGLFAVSLIAPSYMDLSGAIRAARTTRHPELLRNAVIAAEASSAPLAATFAQQLAKGYTIRHHPPSRHLTRQLREFLVAKAINVRYPNDQILATYMEHVYMGPGIEGMEAAARAYVGKTTRDLDAAECALLAGMIRSPSSYSPLRHADRAIQRRNDVLNRMLQRGVINQRAFETAIIQPLRPAA